MDLATAMADRLGLTLNFVPTPGQDLRAGVVSGELDAVMASMTDTAKRQEEVDFVEYPERRVSSIVVRANLAGLTTWPEVCAGTGWRSWPTRSTRTWPRATASSAPPGGG